MRTEKFKNLILAPLALALILLVLVSVLSVNWIERREAEQHRIRHLGSAKALLQKELESDINLMAATLKVIAQDDRIRSAFLARNREALLRRAAPLFEALRSEHRITHFYFSGPDRVNFLRVHRPDLHGDTIQRFTTLEAELTGRLSAGLDLGRFQGLLTLRVVAPWYHEGELVGFLELGEEVEHIVDKLHDVLLVDIIVLVRKDLLVREYWEFGMARLERTPSWDQFPSLVAVDWTTGGVPENVAEYLLQEPGTEIPFQGAVNGRPHRGGLLALHDAADQPVGQMVILVDATQQIRDANSIVTIIGGVSLAVGGVLFLFFFFFLGRIEKEAVTVNRRLREARDSALEASRLKSEFLANMSHEIRTPLNGVVGMTQVTLTTELTAVQREYIETVKTSAEALSAIVEDILDFSKLEAGKPELVSVEFDLRDRVHQALERLDPRTSGRALELTCQISPEVPELLIGDPGRLGDVLDNLVGNAVKFTPQGDVVVGVELEEETDEEISLHFRVVDSGIGIPPEKQSVIFDAFVQADGTYTRKFRGTGLGLAIAARLIELMGGQIWVESAVGAGSTFHFTARFGRSRETAAAR